MKYTIYLLCILKLLVGCSGNKSSKNKAYPMKVDELIATKGEPIKKDKNLIDEKYQMYHYQDEVYQVDQNHVMAKFRNPKQKEKYIQYWRHFLADEFYEIKPDPNSDSQHTKVRILTCPQRGLTIYFKQTGEVLRISESLRRDDE